MSRQDLRKRIKSVRNTQQITKAMKMVASARLNKAQQKALSTTPFAKKLHEMLQQAFRASVDVVDPLGTPREVKKTAYIIVGADKGLAGAYTSNIMKQVFKTIKGKRPDEYLLIALGRKPKDILRHNKYAVYESFTGFSDKPTLADATKISQLASDLFLREEVDKVEIIYTHFINSLTYEIKTETLLPVEFEQDDEVETDSYIFDPSEDVVLSLLLPKAINFSVYNALLQASASELGSRMTAMTTASDNAGQLIESLDLEYNRLRQAQITNEISEIIGGANALQ